MPWIEGLGDEVTLVLGCFLLSVVALLAWLSTHTQDLPILREVGVIVVELTQRTNRATPNSHEAEERSRPEGSDSNGSSDGQEDAEEAEGASGPELSTSHRDDGESSLSRKTKPKEAAAIVEKEMSSLQATSLPSTSSTPAGSNTTNIPDLNVRDNSLPDSQAVSLGDGSLSPELPDNYEGSGLPDLMSEPEQLICQMDGREKATIQSETVIPPASVVVSEETSKYLTTMQDSNIPDHPGEEEMRRRRVQYYQTSSSSHSEGLPVASSTPTASESSNGSRVDNNASNVDAGSVSQGQEQSFKSSMGDCRAGGTSHDPLSEKTEPVTTAVLNNEEPLIDFANPQTNLPSDSHDPVTSQIRVKLKYMNETHRLVVARPSDTIGDFRRTHFQPELADNKLVRFIFNGQDLRDDHRTLQACNIADNCTMHCLITQQTQPQSSATDLHDEEEESMLGSFMYPLFVLVLVVVWYFRLTYRQYFSALSTVVLLGITFLLGLSYVSSLRGRGEGDHPHAD